MIMPFGKHKGKRLEDIPQGYLRWVIENCEQTTAALRAEIHRLIREDGASSDATSNSGQLAIPALAGRWYRRLACEFHPDRGGSHEAMVIVNRCNDLLLEMAGVAR